MLEKLPIKPSVKLLLLALKLQRNQEWLQLENAYVDVTCLTAAGLFSTLNNSEMTK